MRRTHSAHDAAPGTSAPSEPFADMQHRLVSARSNKGAIFGWSWVLGLIGLMGFDVWSQARAVSVSSNYYLIVWGLILTLVICGTPALIRISDARWMLRVLATSVACYLASSYILSGAKAHPNGANDALRTVLFAVAFLIGVVGVLVALSIRFRAQSRRSRQGEITRSAMIQTNDASQQ